MAITGPRGVFSTSGTCAGFVGTTTTSPDNQTDNDDNGDQNGITNPPQIVSPDIALREMTESQLDGDSDSNTELTIDFGLMGYELGNRVWLDADNSGDTTTTGGLAEPGIDGVIVELLDASKNPVDGDWVTPGVQPYVDTTTNGGYYFFGGLPAGDYTVRISASNFTGTEPLAEYISSTGPAQEANPNNDVDNNDNGIDAPNPSVAGICSGVVTLGGSSEPQGEAPLDAASATSVPDSLANMSVDFGFFEPVAIGDFVWKDLDADGVQDAGEPGIAGVELALEQLVNGVWAAATGADGNPVANETSDVNGNYIFDGLSADTFRVIVVGTNWTTGVFSATGACAGFEGTTGDGGDNQDNTDDNGDQDGVTNPAQIISQAVVLLPGTEPVNDGDTSDSTDLTIDFGFVGYNLGNMVWWDADNSGDVNALDGASPGVDGVIVELRDASGVPVPDPRNPSLSYRDTTTGGGLYLFTGLAAGQYRVVLLPGNFGLTGPLLNYYPSNGPAEEDNADNDGDNNDNGLDALDGGYPGSPSASGVFSSLVTLGLGDVEPILENPNNDNTSNIDGRSNLTVDFGLYRPVQVGDLVFLDTDADGDQTAEPPLAGVTLSLFVNDGTGNFIPAKDFNGVSVPSQTTGPNGLYCFTQLPPGEYFIRVTGNVSGYIAPTVSGGDPDNDDNTDSNLEGVGVFLQTQPVTLIDETEPGVAVDGDTTSSNKTVDLGFIGYSLGNYVWLDVDNSGDAQSTEAGIPDVILSLCDAAGNPVNRPGTGTPYTDTTDANGFYLFQGLAAGQYIVKIAAGEFGAGEPLNGLFSSSGAAESGTPNDDIDQDDNGLNGTVPFTPAAAGVQSAVVGLGTGGLPEPTGETPTASGTPGNDGTPLPDVNNHLALDFGFVGPVRLGDLVWYDENVNGVQDGGPEVGIGGVRLQLEVCNAGGSFGPVTNILGQPVGIELTNVVGFYDFENLAPGNYRVTVMADNWNDPNPFGPSGPYAGAFGTLGQGGDDPNNSDDNGDDDFVVAPADGINSVCFNLEYNGEGNKFPTGNDDYDATLDFGIARGLSLGNRVWFDTDNSATLDAGEQGVDGVRVVLYNADGSGNPTTPVDTTVTCGGGYYLFTLLPPGDYVVVIPADQFAEDSVLSGYYSSATTMSGTGVVTETLAPDPDANPADNDDNGYRVNVPFSPFFRAVISRAVTLNPAAPGEPVLEPDATDPCAGTDPAPDNLSNLTVDFGFYQTCVSNLVWIDDQDGEYDAGSESGFAGIQLQLFAANGITPIQTGPDGILGTYDDNVGGVLSDGAGNYTFCGLPEGDYVIKLVAPLGYTSSSGTPGSATGPYEPAPDPDNQVDDDDNGERGTGFNTGYIVSKVFTQDAGNEASVDLNSGLTNDNTVDFALYEIYTVGNQVWFDTDNDGEIDFLEQGVEDVVVRLYTATAAGNPDTLVATTTTDNDGFYLFTWLDSGAYVVVLPAGNFAAGGPLEGYNSSLSSLSGTGGYQETAAPDPDSPDLDHDDNGYLAIAGAAPAAGLDSVRSLAISLGTDGADELLGEQVTALFDPALDRNSNYGLDFGFYQNCLGNLVWEDLDNDGEKDATEIGLAGLTIQLFAADGTTELNVGPDGVLGSADDAPGGIVTGPAGAYVFCGLPDGDYIVKVDVPFGYASSTGVNGQPVGPYEPGTDPKDNEDNDDNGTELIEVAPADTFAITLTDTLRAGAAGALGNNVLDYNGGTTLDPSVDLGLFPTFSLGNQVFFDANNNAAKEPAELGVAGVCVSLYEADAQGRPVGDTIATDLTDAAGFYRFDGLVPGNYIVALPDSNFDAGKPLDTYHSSGTIVNGSFVFSEATAPDPDNDRDNDDNGTLLKDVTSPFDGYVLSQPVTLQWRPGQEPLNETPRDGTPEDTRDDQSNYTVDFGFYRVDVGNLVFDDVNNSGTVDGAEGGYPGGLVMKLCAADGTTEVPVGPDGIYGTADDAPGGIVSGPNGEYLLAVFPKGNT
ncbi:MAG: SdrD B-like domain-containing protein [Bacteroidia bacterium]